MTTEGEGGASSRNLWIGLQSEWEQILIREIWEFEKPSAGKLEHGEFIIIGDETYLRREEAMVLGLEGRPGETIIDPNHPGLMYCFLCIGNGSKLGDLSPDFHATEIIKKEEGPDSLEQTLGEMNEGLEGKIMIFTGTRGVDWEQTQVSEAMRIVLESIRTSASFSERNELSASLFLEQTDTLKTARGETLGNVLAPIYEMRDSKIKPRFKSYSSHYVAKTGHPYLGYCDLFLWMYRKKKLLEINRERVSAKASAPKLSEYRMNDAKRSITPRIRKILDEMGDRVSEWSFEDARILAEGLLSKRSLESPSIFYNELRNLGPKDSLSQGNKDLGRIVNFHSKRLCPNLKFSEFMKFEQAGGVSNFKWASDCMIDHKGGCEVWLDSIDEDSYQKQFDLFFSAFAQSSRRSDSEGLRKWGVKMEKLIEDHRSELDESRVQSWLSYHETAMHTVFCFGGEMAGSLRQIDKSDKRMDVLKERALGNNSKHLDRIRLGSRLEREFFGKGMNVDPKYIDHLRGLRDLDLRHESEDYQERNRARHTTHLINALIELYRRGEKVESPPEDAEADEGASSSESDVDEFEYRHHLEYLKLAKREAFPNLSISAASPVPPAVRRDSLERPIPDTWRMAALLKLGFFLRLEGEEVPEEILELIEHSSGAARSIPVDFGVDGNPEARVISWAAQLCDLEGKEEYRDELIGMFISKSKEETAYADAMGVTFGCHLMKLEGINNTSGGEKSQTAEKYLERVLEGSANHTKDWVNSRSPVPEDPYKPLTFSYL